MIPSEAGRDLSPLPNLPGNAAGNLAGDGAPGTAVERAGDLPQALDVALRQ
jgi:hypothetical protein